MIVYVSFSLAANSCHVGFRPGFASQDFFEVLLKHVRGKACRWSHSCLGSSIPSSKNRIPQKGKWTGMCGLLLFKSWMKRYECLKRHPDNWMSYSASGTITVSCCKCCPCLPMFCGHVSSPRHYFFARTYSCLVCCISILFVKVASMSVTLSPCSFGSKVLLPDEFL